MSEAATRRRTVLLGLDPLVLLGVTAINPPTWFSRS